MTVPQRLSALRARMKDAGVSLYLVPTSDFHNSEYVGDHFKCREYLSGFTGSAGTLVVGLEEAGLWTDGRYFLQAEEQLKGSGIRLFKMGEPGVPTVNDYIAAHLSGGENLGLDGRTVSARFVRTLQNKLKAAGAGILPGLDLAGDVWQNRPALSCQPVWELSTAYAGKSRAEKLALIREKMAAHQVDRLLLTALDEIAWLLNLRGDDVECNPVFLSYALLDRDRLLLFAQDSAFSRQIKEQLVQDGIDLCPYPAVFETLKQLPPHTCIWLDSSCANFSLFGSLPAGTQVLDRPSPVCLAKSIKNSTEVENQRQAHLYDGLAVTRFIHWLKTHPHIQQVTELSAAEQLETFRKEQPGYLAPSFETIAAYGPHGAIVHYSATPESSLPLQPAGFILVDSGGHYLTGTTDITRTIALGALSSREKEMYTLVLKGHLALANARFRHGCTGRNLDYLARAPLWEKGLDFNHGTGHGVGYLLNVHEGPNNIRWRPAADPNTDVVLEPGMITSNEPGFYQENSFGIRLENLIVCRQDSETEYGRFLSFENLTLVPFDRDAIEVSLLEEKEKTWLNQYHSRVYQKLAPLLPVREAEWLRRETLPL